MGRGDSPFFIMKISKDNEENSVNCEKHPHEVPLCSCSMKKGKHPVHVPNFIEVTEKLRSKSLKITQQRQSVLNVLQDKHIPLSIKEIHSKMDVESDLATVYRTMHILEEAGLVRRCDFEDGVARFELACSCGNLHHQHLVCKQCGIVIDITTELLEQISKNLEMQTGYTNIISKLEFFGICPQCQRR